VFKEKERKRTMRSKGIPMKKEQRKTDIKKKKNIEVNPIPKVALRTNERTNERTLKFYI
jgi:hypothetical protein